MPERAFITALAMAAVEGTAETDPMPLAPNGLVVEVESIVSRIRGGIFVALGIAQSIRLPDRSWPSSGW